jgi:hypothetical protein
MKLHYAELNLKGDIPCYNIDNVKDISNIIKTDLTQQKNKVYLFNFEFGIGESEVIISENISTILKFLQDNTNLIKYSQSRDMFLQEYPSYEDAYRVALAMMENSELCYNESSKLN